MRVGTELGALGPVVGVGRAVSQCLWQRSLPSTWQMSDSRERSPVILLLFLEALNKCCASLCPRSCQLGAPVPQAGGGHLTPGGLGGAQLLLPGFLQAWELRVLKLGTYRPGDCLCRPVAGDTL